MKIYGDLDYFGANIPGHISNMRLIYASGRLKLVGYDGNDLSSTNPGSVTVVRGITTKTLNFTSSPLFDDDFVPLHSEAIETDASTLPCLVVVASLCTKITISTSLLSEANLAPKLLDRTTTEEMARAEQKEVRLATRHYTRQ
jgi:hypothetical protein